MPSTHPARVAVIGAGPRAVRSVLPALRHTGADLVAIAEPQLDALHQAQRQFGARRAFRDHRELLEREILDFVIVADEHDALTITRFAMQQGIPVLIGVAPTLRSPEARQLATNAAASGTLLGQLAWTRFDPATRHAVDLIRSGVAGNPVSTTVRAVRSLPAGRYDMETLLIVGFMAAIDVALQASGTLLRVQFERAEIDQIVRSTAIGHTDGGAIVTIEMTALPAGRADRWSIEHIGSSARIAVPGTTSVEVEYWDSEAAPRPSSSQLEPHRRSDVTLFEGAGRIERALAAGIADFARAVLEDGVPFAPLAAFLPAMQLAEALAGPPGAIDPQRLTSLSI